MSSTFGREGFCWRLPTDVWPMKPAARNTINATRMRGTVMRTPATSRAWLIIIIESKRSEFGRCQERTSLLFIVGGHNDLDHSQAVDGEPVSLPQRFASQLAGDTGGCEKSLNLLRVDLAAGRKNTDLILHAIPHRVALTCGHTERSRPLMSGLRTARRVRSRTPCRAARPQQWQLTRV